MRGKNTIIINGMEYDAVSGRPIVNNAADHAHAKQTAQPNAAKFKRMISDFGPARAVTAPTKPKPAVSRTVSSAHAVHNKPDRSHILHRKATKAPVAAPKAVEPAATTPAKATIARSPMISRFGALHTAPSTTPTVRDTAKKPAHKVSVASATPVAASATSVASQPQKIAVQQQASRSLKEHLITEQMEKAEHPQSTKPKGVKKLFAKKPRSLHIASLSIAVMLFGGYLTYINMPNLSVRVASAQSGVQASYPEYRPSGYSFSGPVAYSPGEVTLRFKSNSSAQAYTVKQRASNWDSQAVLDNFVNKESDSYLTYSEQGLTIYTYSNKAAWVNGGVLYTIDGDAPLSSEQVLRIAASM